MHQTYHHFPLNTHGPRALVATLPPMFPPYYPPSPPEYYAQEPCGVIPHNPHHACSCSGECRSNFAPHHQRSFAPVSAHRHHHPSPTRPIAIASSSSLPTVPSSYSSSSSSSSSGAAFYSQYSASYPTSPTPVSPPWSVSSSPQSNTSGSPPQSSSPVAQRFCHIMPAGKAPPKALMFIEERPNKPETKPVLADGFNAPMPRTRKLCKRRKPVGGDLLSAFDPNYEFKPGMYCRVCGIVSTPQWRRGPDGKQSLCNACGLKFLKVLHQEKNSEAQQEPEKLSLSNLLN